jgi:glycosyltransferase involved in cell wall biosynthesis
VAILKDIAAKDKRFKVILNTKNFGPSRSGLYVQKFASGDCLVLMASDLEDPPELIGDFLEKWGQGYKMVATIKKGSREFFLMRGIRKLYYKTLSLISDVELIENFTGFGLYDMSIVGPLVEYYDIATYFRGLMCEYGYDIAFIEHTKPKRVSGKSSYNFYRYFDYAMLGITSYSTAPLRLATFIGFILSGLSVLVAIFYFVLKLLLWPHIPFGTAPLVIGLFFFSSVQIFLMGLIGEYIAVILSKVTDKPLVLAREYINFDGDEKE